MAHTELERICLDRETFNYKRKLSQDYEKIIYDGTWYGPLRRVSRVLPAQVPRDGVWRCSPPRQCRPRTDHWAAITLLSLYDEGLATYSEGDTFDRNAAEGFLLCSARAIEPAVQVRKRMQEKK